MRPLRDPRRVPTRRAGGLAALLLSLAAWAMPFPALATTVSVRDEVLYDDDGGDDLAYQAVEVAGEPGERNRMRVTFTAGATTVTDYTARVSVAAPCERITDHAARCPAGALRALRVTAGDGADHVTVLGTAASIALFGGTGADILTVGGSRARIDGGPGRDELRGGGGDDRLRGGPGADRLHGDRGDDLLRPGAPAGDVLNGGSGRDTVTYRGHASSLLIDLGRGVASDVRGRASLGRVEDAEGSRRRDRIIGDGHANRLEGFGGRDSISGGRGADELHGGGCANHRYDLTDSEWSACTAPAADSAVDALRGGRGDDTLELAGPGSHGGPGEDVLVGSDDLVRERLPRSSEWWRVGDDDGPDLSTRMRTEGGHLVARVRDGEMRLVVREAAGRRRVLARGTVAAGPDSVRTGRVPLTAIGRRVFRAARGPIRVWVQHGGPASVLLDVAPAD